MTFTKKITLFFREVWLEMKKVSWLTRSEVFKYTMLVLGVTIGAAIFLGGLDYIFSQLVKLIILR